jgi:hypothetical protein
MASYRKLDAPRTTKIRGSLVCFSSLVLLCVAVLLCAAGAGFAQNSDNPEPSRIERLFQQEQWQDIAKLPPPAGASPDLYFYYGTALARLERWEEARVAFESGLRANPKDSRFPTELAGVAFKQKKYNEAETWLRRALELAPDDSYANDFLATIYFMRGNVEAALKYWNRAGKPMLESVSSEPTPHTKPVLLDRAFTFSPASTLRLRDLLTTEARIRQLGVFPTSHFELQAREDGKFDLVFRNFERNGCGSNKWECLLLVFGGTPAQTVNFDYFNVRRDAINFHSLFRWDAEKRRVLTQLDTPLAGMAKWHLRLDTDLRNENWSIRSSFSGPAPLLAALNLKREAARVEFTDAVSGRWRWFEATEFSNRSYNNVLAGNLLTPQLLTGGAQLKQTLGADVTLLHFPERRLIVESGGALEVARLWSGNGRDFAKFSGTLRLHWFPQHTGDKYEFEHTVRVGETLGSPPFDELFMFGVLGDSALPVRAHIATRDGKKGSAPLGRNYFLSNWDVTRNFSPISLLKLKVGPFVDAGKITDRDAAFASHEWLWDTGIQAKLQVFGFGVTLSYGRDLRSGRNALLADTR